MRPRGLLPKEQGGYLSSIIYDMGRIVKKNSQQFSIFPTMTRANEDLFEQSVIQRLQAQGYRYISGPELDREPHQDHETGRGRVRRLAHGSVS